MKVLLLTGGTGFLGSEIARLANAAGWRVRTLVRVGLKTDQHGVEMVRGAVEDQESVLRACEGATAVVHAAGLAHVFGPKANDFERFRRINSEGTGNVVQAAVKLGIARVAVVSSVSVYGPHGSEPPTEGYACRPESAYAKSKLLGEQRALEAAAGKPITLSILRVPTAYGEGDPGNVAKLIHALRSGRFVWAGDGTNRKTLVHKQDVARASLIALERASEGTEIYNLPGHTATMRETVNTICAELGRKPPRVTIPMDLLRVAADAARLLGDAGKLKDRLGKFLRDDVYDSTKFEAEFAPPPLLPLAEGFRRQIAAASVVTRGSSLLRETNTIHRETHPPSTFGD